MFRITKKVFSILSAENRRKVGLLAVLMLIGAIMESVGVSLILPLAASLMEAADWRGSGYANLICNLLHIDTYSTYVRVILYLLIAVFVIKNLYLMFEYYFQYSFIAKCRFDMQKKLIQGYLYRRYEFFLNVSSGEIVRVISSDTNQTTNVLINLLIFYTELIVCAALVITIFLISYQIALFLLIVLCVETIIITFVVKPVMSKYGEDQRIETSETNKWILQAINGMKGIKVSKTEPFFEKMYSMHATGVITAEIKSQTISAMPRLIIEACTITAILALLLFSLLQGSNLNDLFSQISAFLVAAVRLLPSVNRISAVLAQTPFLEGGVDSVIKNLQDITPDASRLTDEKIDMEADERVEEYLRSGIVFSDVSYSYPNAETNVLNHANIQIQYGESVGIVGVSGAGKTTAMDIMLGLLTPGAGIVAIDGENLKNCADDWLRRIAYIPQQIFLMDDTIRANVAFGLLDTDIDDKLVWQALEEAQMGAYVRRLPKGINTEIGEQGIRLSGGQRQRIGIARALYRNPDVLFLDEATSAVDTETESAIMESIDHLKGKKTLIIIAHRLSTISNCDVVYRIENGIIQKER